MNMYWIQILLCTDLWSNTHYIKSNIYDKLLYRFWPLFSTWFHTNLFKVYLNYFWKNRHIQRELFDGYLIMYFSQKNILSFLIYFLLSHHFEKQKHQSIAFLTRIKNIYFVLIESKKRSRYGQKKANSYKAHRFVHAHLHVFHWTVGLYYQKYLKDYI